jgi:hypothetical protein
LFLPEIGVISGITDLGADAGVAQGQKWKMTRPNERMRILRYGTGEYFARKLESVIN